MSHTLPFFLGGGERAHTYLWNVSRIKRKGRFKKIFFLIYVGYRYYNIWWFIIKYLIFIIILVWFLMFRHFFHYFGRIRFEMYFFVSTQWVFFGPHNINNCWAAGWVWMVWINPLTGINLKEIKYVCEVVPPSSWPNYIERIVSCKA